MEAAAAGPAEVVVVLAVVDHSHVCCRVYRDGPGGCRDDQDENRGGRREDRRAGRLVNHAENRGETRGGHHDGRVYRDGREMAARGGGEGASYEAVEEAAVAGGNGAYTAAGSGEAACDGEVVHGGGVAGDDAVVVASEEGGHGDACGGAWAAVVGVHEAHPGR